MPSIHKFNADKLIIEKTIDTKKWKEASKIIDKEVEFWINLGFVLVELNLDETTLNLEFHQPGKKKKAKKRSVRV